MMAIAVMMGEQICVSRPGNAGLAMWRMMWPELNTELYAKQIVGAELVRLPGTILSGQAGEYVVSVSDGKTPEVILRFAGKPLRAGMEVEFEGVAVGVERRPLRLRVEVKPGKLEVFGESQRGKGTICLCYDSKDPKKTPL